MYKVFEVGSLHNSTSGCKPFLYLKLVGYWYKYKLNKNNTFREQHDFDRGQ